MKPVSIQMYTLRELAKDDFLGTIRKVAEIGYAGVEFAGLFDHGPAEVRKVLDDLGLRASSAHLPLPTPETLSQVVDTAGTLGYQFVVCPFQPPEKFQTAEAIGQVAGELQSAAELLKPHGLTFCYHNHSHEMIEVDGKYALDLMLEQAPDVAPQIDTYWASNFGVVDVPAFVGKWAHRAPTLHIKDGPLVKGEPHTAVGSGKMDVPAVIAAADENVLQWLIVELDQCATDMLTAAAQSCAYLTANGLAQGRK